MGNLYQEIWANRAEETAKEIANDVCVEAACCSFFEELFIKLEALLSTAEYSQVTEFVLGSFRTVQRTRSFQLFGPHRDTPVPGDSMPLQRWTMKVAGVSFENRPQIVSKLKRHEAVRFRRDLHNACDPYAVRIETMSGEQIGFVPRKYSARVSAVLGPLGGSHIGWVQELTGGTPCYPNRGVVVAFEIPNELFQTPAEEEEIPF
jgi:hypothetical protein